MKRLSKMYLKTALVLLAIALLASSLYVMGAPPLGFQEVEPASCPPPFWMWVLLAGLLLPWIPFLLLRRNITVTFDDGLDNRPYLQKYKKGEKVVPPEIFNRPGCKISGWYLSKKFEKKKKWDFRDKVQTSMTLHAKWEPETLPDTTETGDLA